MYIPPNNLYDCQLCTEYSHFNILFRDIHLCDNTGYRLGNNFTDLKKYLECIVMRRYILIFRISSKILVHILSLC